MSAPFQPGDVVVCVDDRPNPRFGVCAVSRGRLYKVKALRYSPRSHDLFGRTNWGVAVAGVTSASPTGYIAACRFRKIDDEVTEEFREQLRKLPVRERVA